MKINNLQNTDLETVSCETRIKTRHVYNSNNNVFLIRGVLLILFTRIEPFIELDNLMFYRFLRNTALMYFTSRILNGKYGTLYKFCKAHPVLYGTRKSDHSSFKESKINIRHKPHTVSLYIHYQ